MLIPAESVFSVVHAWKQTISGCVQSRGGSEKAVEKEMHEPREAARLCLRSGCNKEAMFVPYSLVLFVLQNVGDFQSALSI